MFQSFFPQPKLFFSSLAIWSGLLILIWYTFGKTLGEALGFDLTEAETVIGLGHFITPEFFRICSVSIPAPFFSTCGVHWLCS